MACQDGLHESVMIDGLDTYAREVEKDLAIFANGGLSNTLTTAAIVSTFTQWEWSRSSHPVFSTGLPQLPGRTRKQIRDRWVNYLNPAINNLPFCRDDDLRLWRGHSELGKRWAEIGDNFFHWTRSENCIKNRWYSVAFKKFITKEFGRNAYVDAM